jgi:hypothetical protein
MDLHLERRDNGGYFWLNRDNLELFLANIQAIGDYEHFF